MESSLPKGMFNLSNDELKSNRNVLSSFINISNNLFTEVVEFPPIAFAETFKKGANITGDKTYEFKDRSNRDLILTPDSQAHLFNYYLSTNNQDKNVKYSWVCPIFRYRNIPKRHYYQIGYASINHSYENEIIELFLCTRQLINFVNENIGEEVTITIYNSSLISEIISHGFEAKEESNIFFESFRKLDVIEAITFIEQSFPDSKYKLLLKEIFAYKFVTIDALSFLLEFNEGVKTIKFIRLLMNSLNVHININLANLYCSEILNGVGFSIDINKVKIGDGGIYNLYGSKFNSKINTVISVCVGRGFFQTLRQITSDSIIAIFIKDYDCNIENALLISDELYRSGYRINIHPWTKNNKKYFHDTQYAIFIEKFYNGLVSGKFINDSKTICEKFNDISVSDIISLIIGKVALNNKK